MNSPALPRRVQVPLLGKIITGAGASERRRRALILGYYGWGNLGDELSLNSITAALRGYGFDEITVIGKRPYNGILPPGVSLADSRSVSELCRAVAQCSVMIAGGGTLLQNATGEKSLIYYTSLMRLAAAMGKRVVLCGGVGPVTGRGARARAAAALRACGEVWVRDAAAAGEVKRLCGMEAHVAADPIFFTGYARRGEKKSKSDRGGYVAVQLRRVAGGRRSSAGEAAAVRAAELCRIIGERTGARPLFVSMQDSYDMELCRLAASLCGGETVSPAHGGELFSVVGGARASVGMRLHFLLSSVMSGTPAVALSYDPKVDGAAEMLHLPSFSADSFSPYAVSDAVCAAM